MDPRTGAFVGMDPWEGNPYDPPTLHKYLYAAARPLNWIDPSGREFSVAQLAAVGAMIGALCAISIIQPRTALETVQVGLVGALVGALILGGLAYWALGGTLSGAAATTGGAAATGAVFGAAGMAAQQATRATANVSQLQHAFKPEVARALGLGNWNASVGAAFGQVVQTVLQYPAAIVRGFMMPQGQRLVDVYSTKAPNGQVVGVYIDAASGELVTAVIVAEERLATWGAMALR